MRPRGDTDAGEVDTDRAGPVRGQFGPLRPIPDGGASLGADVADVAGVDPSGNVVRVRIVGSGRRWLLAFLSTDCFGCRDLWRALCGPEPEALPADVSAVIVTKGPDHVPRRDVAASVSSEATTVVMSDAAWSDYRVLGYPTVVVVDSVRSRVIAATTVTSWTEARALLSAT